jgi:hypothetical protein
MWKGWKTTEFRSECYMADQKEERKTRLRWLDDVDEDVREEMKD